MEKSNDSRSKNDEQRRKGSKMDKWAKDKLYCSVFICLTQLYDGIDMYRIYYIKNNYMFRHFTLTIFRLRNEKT